MTRDVTASERIDGMADIGMSGARAKPTELSAGIARGAKLTPIEVFHDGLGVIVDEKNPIRSLTLRRAQRIVTGGTDDRAAIGGADGPFSVYTRNPLSGRIRALRTSPRRSAITLPPRKRWLATSDCFRSSQPRAVLGKKSI